MSKMWEYYEGRAHHKIWDFPNNLYAQGTDNYLANRRHFNLNNRGSEGWELIATRYVVDRTSEEGEPIAVTFYDTYKREITRDYSRDTEHRPTPEEIHFYQQTRNRKKEISEELPKSTHQGYMLRYTNYFLGQRLRGGSNNLLSTSRGSLSSHDDHRSERRCERV